MFLRFSRLISILIISFLLISCGAVKQGVQNKLEKLNKYPGVYAKQNYIASSPPYILINKYKLLHFVDSNNKSVAIAVAISGGGYRASHFALGVMSGLEYFKIKNTHDNLLNRVNYFSSVSGGGFAVGFYLSQYSKYLSDSKNINKEFSLSNAINSDIKSNNSLNMDLQSKFANFKNIDKTNFPLLLQQGILSRGDKLPPLNLGDIFIPKSSKTDVTLPLWVANSSVFQNSSIFSFAPNVLSEYQIDGYYWHNKYQKLKNANNLPMAFAVAASASYPFVFPSMTLASSTACNEECYLQLFDGGLTDNLGIFTALNVLNQDNSDTKILIIIDSAQVKDQVYSKDKKGPGWVRLLWNSLNASPDHMHIEVQSFMKKGFKEFLCAKASNVFLSYISLKDYDKVSIVPTNLHLDLDQQQYLLRAGKYLSKNSKEIIEMTKFLNGSYSGDNDLGSCKTK